MTENADFELADSISEELDGVARVAGFLWQRGWAEAGAGNLTVDVTDSFASPAVRAYEGRVIGTGVSVPGLAGRYLVVSAAGSRFRAIALDPTRGLLVLRVSDDGSSARVVWCGGDHEASATSELATHLVVHECLRRSGSARNAVLHTHPTDLIALNHTAVGADQGTLNRALWSMLPEVKLVIPDGVALVPYQQPGSSLLAEATATALEKHEVAVWDKHGCIATGIDVAAAFDLIDVADKASRIYLRACAAGETPRGLTDDELSGL